MRLIEARSLSVVEFLTPPGPPYAILSHTWEQDEITYQEMSSPTQNTSRKQGYTKIQKACDLAARHGHTYVWIDTCCIDKTSSAELSEAINSMYNWYARADTCYVYLSDVESNKVTTNDLKRCRWITRGWTLQELIAPKRVEFYNSFWEKVGSKLTLASILESCTGIDPLALSNKRPLKSYSVATRMSWAAGRNTTRIEDQAYSLLGIFDVNMSLLYGEEHKAFKRLQEEIMRTINDLTIFAWDDAVTSYSERFSNGIGMDVLAPDPACFRGISKKRLLPYEANLADFTISSKGVFVSGEYDLPLVSFQVPGRRDRSYAYLLKLGIYEEEGTFEKNFGVALRKLNPKTFFRDRRHPLINLNDVRAEECSQHMAENFYIVNNPLDSELHYEAAYISFRIKSLRVLDQKGWSRHNVCPSSLWNEEDQLFLRPCGSTDCPGYGPMILCVYFKGVLDENQHNFGAGTIALLACIVWRAGALIPSITLIPSIDARHAAARLFERSNNIHGVRYYDLLSEYPRLGTTDRISDQLFSDVGNARYEVTAKLCEANFRTEEDHDLPVYELKLDPPKRIK